MNSDGTVEINIFVVYVDKIFESVLAFLLGVRHMLQSFGEYGALHQNLKRSA